MRSKTRRMIASIEEFTPSEWLWIEARAHARQVGGVRWEEAWLAAVVGHAAAVEAQSRALACGASQLAAAALAGAVAACEAEGRLTDEQEAVLRGPIGRPIDRLGGDGSPPARAFAPFLAA